MNAHQYAAFFAQLTPASLEQFDRVFAPQAHFRDPFNDVRGVPAIRRVFEHMFTQCQVPRFEVTEIVEQGPVAYLRWLFHFGEGRAARCVEGVSRVEFDEHGAVVAHIDHWDPAAQLYETLPGIGFVLRALRRRLSADRLAN